MPKVVVYVLCYDDATEEIAEELAAQVAGLVAVRLGPNKYLEGQMYLDVLEQRADEWRDVDYVGTISWKAPAKIRIPDFGDACAKAKAASADVVALLPFPEALLSQAVGSHGPAFLDILERVLIGLGYNAQDPRDPTVPLFVCNYWLATPAWMSKYCEFYKRAAGIMDTDPELQDLLWSHAKYDGTLSEEVCLEIFGTPYIPFHPFIAERLPCFFFAREGANILALQQLPLVPEEAWNHVPWARAR